MQNPLSICLAVTAGGIMIFDCQSHDTHGAMIACGGLRDKAAAAAGFVADIVGVISDCHLCLLTLGAREPMY